MLRATESGPSGSRRDGAGHGEDDARRDDERGEPKERTPSHGPLPEGGVRRYYRPRSAAGRGCSNRSASRSARSAASRGESAETELADLSQLAFDRRSETTGAAAHQGVQARDRSVEPSHGGDQGVRALAVVLRLITCPIPTS